MLILLIMSHCKVCPFPIVQTREIVIVEIFANGQILQWDLLDKINILRSWDKKYVYTYTR